MIVGLDLGSAQCGLVAVNGDAFLAQTIAVDPADVGPAFAAIDACVTETRPELVVVEWASFYVSAKATPQMTAAAASSIGRARETMVRLLDRVEQRCQALGVPIATIQPRTWRKRIKVATQDDAGVRGALWRILGERAGDLRDNHQRDAMGAVLGWQRPPEKPKRVPREPVERAPPRERPAREPKPKRERAVLRPRPIAPPERPCGCVWHGAAWRDCRADHGAQTAEWLGTESERNGWRLRERKAALAPREDAVCSS